MAQIPQINNPITAKNYNYSSRPMDPNTEPFDIVRLTGARGAGGSGDSSTRSRLEMGNRELIPLTVQVAKDPTLAVETLKDLLNVEVLNQALINGHTELYGKLEDLAAALYVTPEELVQEIQNQEQQNTMFSGHEFYDVLREVAKTTTDPQTKELIGNLLKSINFAQNKNEILGALRANMKFLSEYFSPNEKLSAKLLDLSRQWGAQDAENYFDYLKSETLGILKDVSGSLLNDDKTQMLIPLIVHNLSRYNNSPYMCKEYFNLLMTQISSSTLRESLKNSFGRLYSAIFNKQPMENPSENAQPEDVDTSGYQRGDPRAGAARQSRQNQAGERGQNVRQGNSAQAPVNQNRFTRADTRQADTANRSPFAASETPERGQEARSYPKGAEPEHEPGMPYDGGEQDMSVYREEPSDMIYGEEENPEAMYADEDIPDEIYQQGDDEAMYEMTDAAEDGYEVEGDGSQYGFPDGEYDPEFDPEAPQYPQNADPLDNYTTNLQQNQPLTGDSEDKISGFMGTDDEIQRFDKSDGENIVENYQEIYEEESEEPEPLTGYNKYLNEIMSEKSFMPMLRRSGYNIEYQLAAYGRGRQSGLQTLENLLSGLMFDDEKGENKQALMNDFAKLNTIQEVIDKLNELLRAMPDVPIRERLYGAFVDVVDRMAVKNELPQHGVRPPVKSTLDSLTKFIDENINHPALKSLDSFNAANLLQSLLNAPGVFTPLAHYILPLDVNGTKAFGELWVDNDENNPNNTPGTQRNYHLFLTFDIESIGRFEVDLYALGEEVNLALLYPPRFEKQIDPMKERINKIIRNIGYSTRAFETGPLRSPHNLTEIFPKILDKRTTLNTRV